MHDKYIAEKILLPIETSSLPLTNVQKIGGLLLAVSILTSRLKIASGAAVLLPALNTMMILRTKLECEIKGDARSHSMVNEYNEPGE